MAKKIKIVLRRGKYVVDYRDASRKRKRVSFDTMKEAEAHRSELLIVNVKASRYIETEIPKAFLQYFDFIEKRRIGLTASNEKYTFNKIVLWLCNEAKLDLMHEITSFHLEKYQSILLDKGLKGSTINRQFNSIRAWLNKCVKWGSIAKNPMNDVEFLSEEIPDIKTWTSKQVNEALALAPDYLKDVLFFLDRTGRRPIDAGRAKFGDVDEINKTIRVKSYKGGKSRVITLPLVDDLLEMIVNLKTKAKREFRGRDEDFIFLNSKKKPITTNAIRLALRKIGITDVTPYGLRHSFINGLVDDGVQARDIQLLAGHAKFETTIGYTHRDQKHLHGAAQERAKKRDVKRCV